MEKITNGRKQKYIDEYLEKYPFKIGHLKRTNQLVYKRV